MFFVAKRLVPPDFIAYYFNRKAAESQHYRRSWQKKMQTFASKVRKHTEETPLSMKHFVVSVPFVVKTLVISQRVD